MRGLFFNLGMGLKESSSWDSRYLMGFVDSLQKNSIFIVTRDQFKKCDPKKLESGSNYQENPWNIERRFIKGKN